MKRFLSTAFGIFTFSTMAIADESKVPGQIVYEVPKMMCGGCTGRVTKSIQSHKGVSDVHVSLDDHSAKFMCDTKAGCNEEQIKKDLARIQYPARSLSTNK